MNIQYSIIIPHYNIPQLLQRLLNSIPQRDDLQVIVVDDVSPIESQREIEELKNEFPAVEFYSTVINGGGGRARNIGMKHARGKYLIFADADDLFTQEFNNILDSYSGKVDYDVIYFNAKSVDVQTFEERNRCSSLHSFFELAENHREEGEDIFRYIFGEPWCRIIRRDLVEKYGISFDELPIHNDALFAYLTGFYAKKISIDSRIGYWYTDREESVSKQISDNNLIIRARVFARKRLFLRSNAIDLINPIFFSPLIIAIKRRNFTLFRQVVKAVRSERYSFFKYLKDYFQFRLSPIHQREKPYFRCH